MTHTDRETGNVSTDSVWSLYLTGDHATDKVEQKLAVQVRILPEQPPHLQMRSLGCRSQGWRRWLHQTAQHLPES